MKNKMYSKLTGFCFLALLGGMQVTRVSAQVENAAVVKSNPATTVKYAFTLRGKVVDASTHEAFAGARITVANTKLSAMTTADGSFELGMPSGDLSICVEAPGYDLLIIPVQGRSQMDIALSVHTIGSFYNETSLSSRTLNVISSLTPGIASVDEEISAHLSGEVRSARHSGEPGSGSAVFMRGYNSLNINAQPLYVVDGVIWRMQEEYGSIHAGNFNNPLALIDPNDIESFTVLKDGTSIYGSKGANGVILIETKRSKDMATEVSFNGSVGYHSTPRSMPVMDAAAFQTYASDVLSGMYENTSLVEKYRFLNNDPTLASYKASHCKTDWLDEVYQGGLIQNYGVAVRGGDEKALYSLSMGYMGSDGVVKDTRVDRLNVRFNADMNMSDRLKMAYDIAFSQVNQDLRDQGLDAVHSPVYMAMLKGPVYGPYQYNVSGGLTKKLSVVDELGVGNPLAILQNGLGESNKYRANLNAKPTYKVSENLNVVALLGFSWDKWRERYFSPDKGVADEYLYDEYGNPYAVAYNSVRNQMAGHFSFSGDVRAEWKAFSDEVHLLNVYGGYRYHKDDYESNYSQGYNTGSDKMRSIKSTDSNLRTTDGVNDGWSSMSWYANADYSLRHKYFLGVLASMDASSRFGTDAASSLSLFNTRWGVFPSVSAGWLISSERFMKDVDFVNHLKLRVGYGLSGNDNIMTYANQTYIGSLHFLGKGVGAELVNVGSSDLKWEATTKGNIGLDVSMFENRWGVHADVYESRTTDLLTQEKLSDISGMDYRWRNGGSLENRGFELSTNAKVLNQKNWKLDVGAMVGKYVNEITSLPNGSYTTEIADGEVLTQVGSPAGMFYGYKTDGVFSTAADASDANLALYAETGDKVYFGAGDMKFVDNDNNGIIDEDDKQVIGNPNPDFYGNFSFNLRYKNLSMTALFNYSYGNDVYNALRAKLEAGDNIYNQTTAMQNRWVADGQVTSIPRATYGDPMGNARFSDRWIEDGSFLRFKTLYLAYDIPVKSSYMQGLQVWGSVNNLFTLTKYLGADPEFSCGNSALYQGIDAGLTPMYRTINVGVKFNL